MRADVDFPDVDRRGLVEVELSLADIGRLSRMARAAGRSRLVTVEGDLVVVLKLKESE